MSFQKYCIAIAGLAALFFSCTKRVDFVDFRFAPFQQVAGPYWRLNDIQFADNLNGVMHIDNQSLYKTTDGGLTWNLIFTTTPGSLTAFAYPQLDTVYAFTQASWTDDHDVHRSIDGGVSWSIESQVALASTTIR